MRILIAEDELAIQEQVAERLQEQGYVVDLADNGIDALYCGSEYPIDLAIIDLGLPEKDGIEVIKELRGEGKIFPILILTARSRWQEKVLGLEAGADDYLTKPFHIEELVARVTALIRRASGNADNLLQHGDISLNTSSQEVQMNDKDISLTAYEYRLLQYLMLNAGKVCTIEVFIRRLRKKLDPQGELKPIETLRGRGYRLSVAAD